MRTKLSLLVICMLWSLSALAQDPDSIPFAHAVQFGTSGSYSFFCTDVDKDGDIDLAVTNRHLWYVSIFKNNGDGTFAPNVDYGTSQVPGSVFAADLDGDGDQDLATAHGIWYPTAPANTISVLKNNGDGTFANKVDYAVPGDHHYSIFASDLDSDGDLDLIVSNSDSASLSLLKNNGDGTFAAKVDYATNTYPGPVFASDLDGDGDFDIAVGSDSDPYSQDPVSIFKNNGDGTFAAKVDYPTGGYNPWSIFVSDLDGDGDGDLAVANRATVAILKNNGDGTFAPKVEYEAGSYPRSIFAADLDGDGDQDLAVANTFDNISILRNNGDGTFATKVDYKTGSNPSNPMSVRASDLDGDGDRDLIVLDNKVSILENLTVRQPVELWVDITGRDNIRVGGFQTYQLSYANFGSADANDVILLLELERPDGYDLECHLALDTLPVDSIGWSQVPDTVSFDSKLVIPIWIGNIPSQNWKTIELYLKVSDKAGRFIPMQSSLLLARLRYQFAPQRACAEAAAELYEQALLDYGVTVHNWQEFDDLYQQKLREYRQMNQLVSFQDILVDILLEASKQGLLSALIGISDAILVSSEAAGYASSCMHDKLRLRRLLGVTPVRSSDPNDKAMLPGYDTLSHFVALENTLNYMIFFENVDSATADAEDIVIVDTLDQNLDWTTLIIGNMSHPQSCSASFDTENGIITWTCDSIMLPPDTLPPNGEGWVSFSVRPKNSLSSGTQIKNRASIKFDYNPWLYAPMDSNYVINTIDAGRPTSSVNSLPDTLDTPIFNVSWLGLDDPDGSGIATYTVYVNKGDGSYLPWLTDTTATSASYIGEYGHTYYFYCTAVDNVGHIEERPIAFDSRTTVRVFLRGDPNRDGNISVADAVYLINYLFKGGTPPNPLLAGDANCDGNVSLSDVVYLINYLFRGGSPPEC